MEPHSSENLDNQYNLFLVEGLIRDPSPVLLIVDAAPIAQGIAGEVYAGRSEWDEQPEARGRLLWFDPVTAAGMSSQEVHGYFSELATTDDWIYIGDLDMLCNSSGGQRFLAALLHAIARHEVAAVLASATAERISDLRLLAPRLMGFATLCQRATDEHPGGLIRTTSLVLNFDNALDTGWVVAVRFDLEAPMAPTTEFSGDDAVAGAMQLVESVHLVEGRGLPPAGAMIRLKPQAFTITQEATAFTTAANAAKRVIGRPLSLGESVTATRALYYA